MHPFQDAAGRNFDFGLYVGQVGWVRERTIFVTRHGSHAYGTNLPGSDLDLRGICIPPAAYYHGNVSKFHQTQNNPPKKGESDNDVFGEEDPDFVIFGINKFVELAVKCNPNALELIFTDPSDHLHVSQLGQRLIDNRQLFLTRRAKDTFSGYAMSQLKKIKKHYRWVHDPPKAPPTRSEMGLPERTVIPKDQLAAANTAIQKQLDQWAFADLDLTPDERSDLKNAMAAALSEMQVSTDNLWMGAARMLGMNDNFIELLDLERRYTSAKREWDQYQGWLQNRNPKRAALEAKFGYDTKYGMHLVRLLRICREILTYGEMRVRREDAPELLEIRGGSWSIERLIEYTESEDKALGELAAKATHLPAKPPIVKIDALLVDIIEEALDWDKIRASTAAVA